MTKSAIYCEHANECPQVCPCPMDCYCRKHSCRDREAATPAQRWVTQYLDTCPGLVDTYIWITSQITAGAQRKGYGGWDWILVEREILRQLEQRRGAQASK